MNLGLDGAVGVVTGASSGIGLATAEILLAEGARVAICGRDEVRLASARAGLAASPDRLLAVRCDVLDQTQCATFADKVRAWGGGRIDLLVNNAGQGRQSTFESTNDAAWREELELKFFSQIYPIRAFKPALLSSPAPAIVIVNSLLAVQPEPHMVATSAARAGVQSLVRSLAGEFAPAIRVNAILLGLVDSGQWRRRFDAREDKAVDRDRWYGDLARKKGIPLGRLGKPDEAARTIVFLGSRAASYVTGASLDVSGGLSRHI